MVDMQQKTAAQWLQDIGGVFTGETKPGIEVEVKIDRSSVWSLMLAVLVVAIIIILVWAAARKMTNP